MELVGSTNPMLISHQLQTAISWLLPDRVGEAFFILRHRSLKKNTIQMVKDEMICIGEWEPISVGIQPWTTAGRPTSFDEFKDYSKNCWNVSNNFDELMFAITTMSTLTSQTENKCFQLLTLIQKKRTTVTAWSLNLETEKK